MSLSKVDREFYSLMITLLNPELKYSDRYYEALDELNTYGAAIMKPD